MYIHLCTVTHTHKLLHIYRHSYTYIHIITIIITNTLIKTDTHSDTFTHIYMHLHHPYTLMHIHAHSHTFTHIHTHSYISHDCVMSLLVLYTARLIQHVCTLNNSLPVLLFYTQVILDLSQYVYPTHLGHYTKSIMHSVVVYLYHISSHVQLVIDNRAIRTPSYSLLCASLYSMLCVTCHEYSIQSVTRTHGIGITESVYSFRPN